MIGALVPAGKSAGEIVALLPTGEIVAESVAGQSAPVTHWAARILLTLVVLAVIALGIWGMRRGWLARERRQSDLPTPPEVPAHVAAEVAAQAPAVAGVPGTYVATTSTGDLLDRIVVHGLGNLGRADLYLRSDGVLIDRVGESPLWIPQDHLRDVRLGSGQAQKAYEAGGLILITWQLGDRHLDTGFRADDADAHRATATALSALLTTEGSA